MMRLCPDELIAGPGVDLSSLEQDIVGPQNDFPVTHLPGETRALGDQTTANAEPAPLSALPKEAAASRRALCL